MTKKSGKSETVKVPQLGCMRKSTVETGATGKTIEYVEVWTSKELKTGKNEPVPEDEQ